MLTLKQLKDMPPGTIFASGIVKDSPEGINMVNTGKDLKWIAKRGYIHDWTIYISWANVPEIEVAQYGDKIFTEANIRKLVECDQEAFEMYRH